MNSKVRNTIVILIPLLLMIVAIVFAPGTVSKLLTAWGYVLGAFQGALGYSLLAASRKSDQ